MKKIALSIGIIAVLILSSMVSTVYADDNQSKQDRYTHTVFMEAGTQTWCPPCATAAETMANIYAGGGYDFEYVALVGDMNSVAYSRSTQLGVSSIPDYYFDGGYTHLLGAQSTGTYTSTINTCGARTVADIDISVSASCLQPSQYLIDIDCDITNNEASEYSGYIRGYVTEKISRWDTNNGVPYHHAMIGGFAFNQAITIPAGDTLSLSTTWDGSSGFSDLVQSNTKIMIAVFDGGGGSGEVDESKAITPTLIVNDPPATPSAPSGPSDGIPESVYSFSSSTTDPESDDVYYLFDWGDGSDSGWLGPYSSGDPVSADHAWFTAGMHDVKVKAKDTFDGESDWSAVSTFEVIDDPPATPDAPTGQTSGIHASQYAYSTNPVTDPDGDDVEYRFDWGDGNISAWDADTSASYAWALPGTYEVKAQARDIYGAESGWSTALSVDMGNRPPATPPKPAGPDGGVVGDSYVFSGASSDPDGDPIEYQFDWGDGELSDWSENYRAAHIWDEVGEYYVKVRVRDAWDNSEWSPARTFVIVDPLVADAGGPYEVIEGQTLELSGSATGGAEPYYWSWNFGDGETSSDQNPTHVYADEGQYTVTLDVRDRYDNEESDQTIVVVLPSGSLLADAGGPYEGIPDVAVEFSGSAEGGTGSLTWSWDFGDGQTSTLQNPSHVYASVGTYEVTLYVEDGTGLNDIDTTTVTIYENSAPAAPSITGPAEGKSGVEYTYNFSAVDSEGNDVYFMIDWGDGSEVESAVVSSGEVLQVSHTWDEKDDFSIQAKAVDIWDAESDWATLVVSMPYVPDHPVLGLLFEWLSCLMQRFPAFANLISIL